MLKIGYFRQNIDVLYIYMYRIDRELKVAVAKKTYFALFKCLLIMIIRAEDLLCSFSLVFFLQYYFILFRFSIILKV